MKRAAKGAGLVTAVLIVAGTMVALAVYGLTAEAPSTEPTTGSISSTGIPTGASESPASTDGPNRTATSTERGNHMARIGESIRAKLPDGTLTLVIDAISVAESRPGRGVTAEPQLGRFLIIDATATFEATGVGEMFMALSPDTFGIASLDGIEQSFVATEGSFACYDTELLPLFLDAGQTATGKLVLDSASTHGFLIYAPDGQGWEWTI